MSVASLPPDGTGGTLVALLGGHLSLVSVASLPPDGTGGPDHAAPPVRASILPDTSLQTFFIIVDLVDECPSLAPTGWAGPAGSGPPPRRCGRVMAPVCVSNPCSFSAIVAATAAVGRRRVEVEVLG